jgi:hypothetical protein
MGNLRFTISGAEDFDPRIWETAYITGIEGIPWKCHHNLSGTQFSIGREIDESGKLNIVWPTSTLGNLCLSSTSLRVRDEPYVLMAEIARGTVYRLKSQTFEWQRIGLKLPDNFFPLAEASLNELLRALVTRDIGVLNTSAQQAINLAIEAATLLSNTFSQQALEARRNNEGRLATLLGVQLAADRLSGSIAESVKSSFNLVAVQSDFASVTRSTGGVDYGPFDAQIELASQADQKICLGPLVDFRPNRIPQWMFMLDENFESVLEAAVQHVNRSVDRYRGQVHLWNCATGLNVPNNMGWSDEEVLRMAVSLIETVRRNDDRSPVLLTIDQPWSEYLRDDATGISPLHFADALIRADLGLSGLALELNFDCWPGGSFPRDPIELSRLIDRWSMLGLPLMVIISKPTTALTPGDGSRLSGWKTQGSAGSLSAETMLRLLISKPSVHAVIWNSDGSHSGSAIPGACSCTSLWNAQGESLPLLGQMAELRTTYLH